MCSVIYKYLEYKLLLNNNLYSEMYLRFSVGVSYTLTNKNKYKYKNKRNYN